MYEHYWLDEETATKLEEANRELSEASIELNEASKRYNAAILARIALHAVMHNQ